ncbi:class I tRNA ligase family protein [Photorhabdus sp. UCH-936]|nr:class I tRNA ligase family protein [Photorhabdus antumapuensis]
MAKGPLKRLFKKSAKKYYLLLSKKIKRDNLLENVKQRSIQIKNHLAELKNDFTIIGEIRGKGLMLYHSCLDKGIIAPTVSLEPYCEKCEKWGYEAFARGECNHCGESSDPSQCESCAMAPDAFEMKNLRCILCNEKVVYKHVERNFLLLPVIAEKLKEKILSSPMRPQLTAWVEEVFAHGIKAWGVTRPDESGL